MGDRSGMLLTCAAELSQQVVYSWWHLVHHREWVLGRRDDQGPASPMSRRADADLACADEAIAHAEAGLKACCAHMDAADRPIIANYLTAAEAIRLWNHAGHAVAAGEKNPALATGLERWFRRYQAMWREVSKESELWRVREMTAWYADRLR